MKLNCKFYDKACRGFMIYTCVITEAKITRNQTYITEIVGKHFPNWCDEEVEAIVFRDTTVHYFPQGLNRIFPALKVVSIDNCGLKSMNYSDLHGLEKLEVLKLESNELQWLPTDLLARMENLKRISFYNNQMECVSARIFKQIETNDWELVDFRKNKNIDRFFMGKCEIDFDFKRKYFELLGKTESFDELMKEIDDTCATPSYKRFKVDEI